MNWIILALLLMIPGAAGLGWATLQKRDVAHRTTQAARTVADAPSADDYLALYTQWSQLSPGEKAENPWGQGPYGGPEMQQRLRAHQSLRLDADLPDLDSGLKSYPPQLADVLYGTDWSRRLTDYQRQRNRRELITTGSAILLFAGGLLFSGGLFKCALMLALRKTKNADLSDDVEPSPEMPDVPRKSADQPPARQAADTPPSARRIDAAAQPDQSRGYFEPETKVPAPAAFPEMARPIAATDDFAKSVSLIEAHSSAPEHSYFGWEMQARQEEQAAISTLMTTRPIAHEMSELTELTEEVSAIRQYAAAQQDQIRKFQDGYDWMIIRRFCLRIIRCIDNLEDRMARLTDDDRLLCQCLEDIRDELIFALESSGVEQFNPDLKSPFKGLEKYAEAIRQRVPAPNAAMAGTIAEIVRPGYQYLINDDEVKIVRCAQVKLYDAAETEA